MQLPVNSTNLCGNRHACLNCPIVLLGKMESELFVKHNGVKAFIKFYLNFPPKFKFYAYCLVLLWVPKHFGLVQIFCAIAKTDSHTVFIVVSKFIL